MTETIEQDIVLFVSISIIAGDVVRVRGDISMIYEPLTPVVYITLMHGKTLLLTKKVYR